jgi:nucleoside transporter
MGSVRFRLCVMMFLEYVIWGAWLPLANNYFQKALGFTGLELGWIGNAFPIAALLTIMIGGQLADRYFAAEKVLAACHLLGGICMLLIPFADNFALAFALMLGHCIFYAPTMAVTNAISFANISDAKAFGSIRLWGTIGWIAASVPMLLYLDPTYRAQFGLPLLQPQDLSVIFTVSGVASLLLAVFSLTLPHTPPMPAAKEGASFTKAISLLSHPVILVLFIVTVFDMVVHTGFFFFTGRFLAYLGVPDAWIMPAMSVSQLAEIFTMAGLGYILKRLGWKTTMTLGILGHAARFIIFSVSDTNLLWLVITINVLHGICYAFFFATVFIFIDEYFPKDIRNNAQGLFNVALLGVGGLIGNFLCGFIETQNSVTKVINGKETPEPVFSSIYMILAGLALATALIFMATFWPKTDASPNNQTG